MSEARHLGSRDEIYVSTDVEADGPVPGPHSLLSIGSVALWADGEEVAEFSVNLQELPEAAPHPVTQRWWRDFPAAWAETRRDPEPPETAIPRYVAWLRDLPARPVFVAYPAVWDFQWIYWYLQRFAHGDCPFGHSGLDVKSLAMAALDLPFRQCTKNNFPTDWFAAEAGAASLRPHVALDDAREQGRMFVRVLRALRAKRDQA